MKLVRILNTIHFDPRKQRFTSLAFKNSTGGGISVISRECVLANGNAICHHIETYYPPPISSQPPVFWELAETNLPIGYTLGQQTSSSGDICHYNLWGVSDKAARDLLLACALQDFQICDNGTERALMNTDL